MLFFNKSKVKENDANREENKNLIINLIQEILKIRQEQSYTKDWIYYFWNFIKNLQYQISDLEKNLEKNQKNNPELIKNFEIKIGELKNDLDELKKKQKILELKEKLKAKSELEKKIFKRIRRVSKEYIKSVIKSIVAREKNLTLPQLKERIVDEQRLCSKSNFYRLISELEKESELGVLITKKSKILSISKNIE